MAAIGRPARDVDPRLPFYPTVLHVLLEAAARAPEREALICGERSITYLQYRRAVDGLANELVARGAAGGRVAVMMGNSIEMAVAMLGAMAAGAQMVPVNPHYTPGELTTILADADPVILICDSADAQRANDLAATLGIDQVIALGPGGRAIDAWLDDPAAVLAHPLPAPETLATLPYTGGTTGLPKGANHTHAEMAIFCPQALTLWEIEFDRERFLNVAPMFHIWGFLFATWTPIYTRGTLVIMPQYKPGEVLAAFQRHRITVFAGGPAPIYFGLTAHEDFAATDFSSLRLCLSGGAPCPADLLRRWEAATGCPILEGWGMSEGAPINSTPSNGVRKPLSVGPTTPMTEVDIVDVETGRNVLGVGEVGEVRLRGPQFTKGYRNRPEENATAIRDGWLYTGDIGYFDADGYLFLVDRKKEMVIVGGYNVYPREIDEILFAHPLIREAAAIGVPDAFKGEVVKAFVVREDGADLTAEEVIAYCADHLVKYKLPVEIAFLDALPKTGAGKIAKKLLR
jgi:long-chain acyl-CoA synthetase